jgi:hypothetical protein
MCVVSFVFIESITGKYEASKAGEVVSGQRALLSGAVYVGGGSMI